MQSCANTAASPPSSDNPVRRRHKRQAARCHGHPNAHTSTVGWWHNGKAARSPGCGTGLCALSWLALAGGCAGAAWPVAHGSFSTRGNKRSGATEKPSNSQYEGSPGKNAKGRLRRGSESVIGSSLINKNSSKIFPATLASSC